MEKDNQGNSGSQKSQSREDKEERSDSSGITVRRTRHPKRTAKPVKKSHTKKLSTDAPKFTPSYSNPLPNLSSLPPSLLASDNFPYYPLLSNEIGPIDRLKYPELYNLVARPLPPKTPLPTMDPRDRPPQTSQNSNTIPQLFQVSQNYHGNSSAPHLSPSYYKPPAFHNFSTMPFQLQNTQSFSTPSQVAPPASYTDPSISHQYPSLSSAYLPSPYNLTPFNTISPYQQNPNSQALNNPALTFNHQLMSMLTHTPFQPLQQPTKPHTQFQHLSQPGASNTPFPSSQYTYETHTSTLSSENYLTNSSGLPDYQNSQANFDSFQNTFLQPPPPPIPRVGRQSARSRSTSKLTSNMLSSSEFQKVKLKKSTKSLPPSSVAQSSQSPSTTKSVPTSSSSRPVAIASTSSSLIPGPRSYSLHTIDRILNTTTEPKQENKRPASDAAAPLTTFPLISTTSVSPSTRPIVTASTPSGLTGYPHSLLSAHFIKTLLNQSTEPQGENQRPLSYSAAPAALSMPFPSNKTTPSSSSTKPVVTASIKSELPQYPRSTFSKDTIEKLLNQSTRPGGENKGDHSRAEAPSTHFPSNSTSPRSSSTGPFLTASTSPKLPQYPQSTLSKNKIEKFLNQSTKPKGENQRPHSRAEAPSSPLPSINTAPRSSSTIPFSTTSISSELTQYPPTVDSRLKNSNSEGRNQILCNRAADPSTPFTIKYPVSSLPSPSSIDQKEVIQNYAARPNNRVKWLPVDLRNTFKRNEHLLLPPKKKRHFADTMTNTSTPIWKVKDQDGNDTSESADDEIRDGGLPQIPQQTAVQKNSDELHHLHTERTTISANLNSPAADISTIRVTGNETVTSENRNLGSERATATPLNSDKASEAGEQRRLKYVDNDGSCREIQLSPFITKEYAMQRAGSLGVTGAQAEISAFEALIMSGNQFRRKLKAAAALQELRQQPPPPEYIERQKKLAQQSQETLAQQGEHILAQQSQQTQRGQQHGSQEPRKLDQHQRNLHQHREQHDRHWTAHIETNEASSTVAAAPKSTTVSASYTVPTVLRSANQQQTECHPENEQDHGQQWEIELFQQPLNFDEKQQEEH